LSFRQKYSIFAGRFNRVGKWDKGIDITPADKTSYTTQSQKVFLKYVENKYCAKHQHLSLIKPKSIPINNLFSSSIASTSCQSYSDPSDWSSSDENYLMRKNVAQTTARQSNGASHLLAPGMLSLNSPSELPHHSGQINPKHNDYHSNCMEFGSTFWIPDITDWWCQHEETH
jgi:hypothetical protein